jgi:hypothetical protein
MSSSDGGTGDLESIRGGNGDRRCVATESSESSSLLGARPPSVWRGGEGSIVAGGRTRYSKYKGVMMQTTGAQKGV